MTFRGASGEAVPVLQASLREKLAAGADPARVGEDLFTVSSLLRTEPALRRVVTDVSIDATAKQRLITEILGGKVDQVAVDLAADAVGRRWTKGRDLPDGLERLGEVSTVLSAGSEGARLEDELFSLGRTVRENPDLRDALSDPSRNREDKAALIDTLLQGKALGATIALARQSLAGSYRTVGVALEEYQQVAAEVKGESVAEVRVAKPLTESELDRLRAALSRQYGRDIHLNMVIDPEVIGGIKVEIGHDIIDGTLSSRLDNAQRQLAG